MPEMDFDDENLPIPEQMREMLKQQREMMKKGGFDFTQIAKEYGVSRVVYSHCHGESRYGDSIRGEHEGIRYELVSGDYLDFYPLKII